MTFRDAFQKSDADWRRKVVLVELYHLRMMTQEKKWGIRQTAEYFGVSVGLISENLKLARFFHLGPECASFPNRQEALKWVKFGSPKLSKY